MSSLADNDTLPYSLQNAPLPPSRQSGLGRAEEDARHESRRHLEFLKSLGQLVGQCGDNLDRIMEGLVQILPSAWQYPEICCARAIVRGKCFTTSNWGESPWGLAGDICVQGVQVGRLEVAYLESCSKAGNSPFTHEESALLSFIATLMARTVERLETHRNLCQTVEQLNLERAALQQSNAALQGILDRIEEERKTTRRSITASIDKLVTPVVQAIEAQVPARVRPMVHLLRQRLEEVASPFADSLSRAFASLTPLEISLCRMLRDNLTTKEIARLRHVSPSTVARQREQIRRKLGIANSDTNLATYLRMFLTAGEGGMESAGPCEDRPAV